MGRRSISPEKAEAIARYKSLISDVLDRRPRTTRRAIALAINSSLPYVTQILNPTNISSLPLKHVDAVVRACRMTANDLRGFQELYALAHPERKEVLDRLLQSKQPLNSVLVKVVAVDDADLAARIEIAVQNVALDVSAAIVRAAGVAITTTEE